MRGPSSCVWADSECGRRCGIVPGTGALWRTATCGELTRRTRRLKRGQGARPRFGLCYYVFMFVFMFFTCFVVSVLCVLCWFALYRAEVA